jgi:hypothetical protein
MRVRVLERDPTRLATLASAWGVKVVPGQAVEIMQVAIADAYLREVEAEARMREKGRKNHER